MYTAIKARRGKVQVIFNADLLLIHNGFLLFDSGNEADIAQQVREGKLVPSWPQKQKDAVLAWLDAAVANDPRFQGADKGL